METPSKEYRLPADEIAMPRRIVLRKALNVGALMAIIVTFILYFDNRSNASVPIFVLMIVLCYAFIVVNIHKGVIRFWREYTLCIRDDGTIHCKVGEIESTIRPDEITQITEDHTSGLLIKTKMELQAIGVPRQLIEYNEVRQKLMALRTIEARTDSWFTTPGALLIGLSLFAAAFLSSNPFMQIGGSVGSLAVTMYYWWWINKNTNDQKHRSTAVTICTLATFIQFLNLASLFLKHFVKI